MLCDGFVIGVGRFGLSRDGPVTGSEVVWDRLVSG